MLREDVREARGLRDRLLDNANHVVADFLAFAARAGIHDGPVSVASGGYRLTYGWLAGAPRLQVSGPGAGELWSWAEAPAEARAEVYPVLASLIDSLCRRHVERLRAQVAKLTPNSSLQEIIAALRT